MKRLLILLSAFSSIAFTGSDNLWVCENGYVEFVSDAPLEKITAKTEQLRGIIEADKRTFAFTVPMNSFTGFNSQLQREHFNENYMESHLHPQATFIGKIVEDIDMAKNGEYRVRAKGDLDIHGVHKERIISATLKVQDNQWSVSSEFTVMLSDHKIAIPKIVNQKIAEEIQVKIKARFIPKKTN